MACHHALAAVTAPIAEPMAPDFDESGGYVAASHESGDDAQ